MMLQIGVKAFLKSKQGKYLLLRRSIKKYPEVPNRWDIAGGRIHPGISLLENLKREIKEETNLLLMSKPHLIAAQDILRIPNKHIVRLTYIADINGQPMLDKHEHEQYKWFTLAEMKKIKDLDIYVKELLEILDK